MTKKKEINKILSTPRVCIIIHNCNLLKICTCNRIHTHFNLRVQYLIGYAVILWGKQQCNCKVCCNRKVTRTCLRDLYRILRHDYIDLWYNHLAHFFLLLCIFLFNAFKFSFISNFRWPYIVKSHEVLSSYMPTSCFPSLCNAFYANFASAVTTLTLLVLSLLSIVS